MTTPTPSAWGFGARTAHQGTNVPAHGDGMGSSTTPSGAAPRHGHLAEAPLSLAPGLGCSAGAGGRAASTRAMQLQTHALASCSWLYAPQLFLLVCTHSPDHAPDHLSLTYMRDFRLCAPAARSSFRRLFFIQLPSFAGTTSASTTGTVLSTGAATLGPALASCRTSSLMAASHAA